MLNESYDPNEPQLFAVNSIANEANEICDFQYTRRRFLEMAGLAIAGIAVATQNSSSEEQIIVCEVNTNKLNIRTGPSIQYPIIDTLIRGEQVTIIEFNAAQSWCNVKGARYNGWVLTAYLSCTKSYQKQIISTAENMSGWGYLFHQAPNEQEIVLSDSERESISKQQFDSWSEATKYTLNGKIYTLPCGSPIPPEAICTCNCVAGANGIGCVCDQICVCNTIAVCTCDKVSRTNCSCDKIYTNSRSHCSCDTVSSGSYCSCDTVSSGTYCVCNLIV